MRNLQLAIHAAQTATFALTRIAEVQPLCPLDLSVESATEVLEEALRRVSQELIAKTPQANELEVPIPRRVKPKIRPIVARETYEDVWDPDPATSRIMISRCRALLLEIIRRAAHDWILYRMHRRMHRRQLAENAFRWLFEEDLEHPDYKERSSNGKSITSFVVICEQLDLDPEMVRRRIRKMNVKTIMCAGRPAERRKRRTSDDVSISTHSSSVSMDTVERPNYNHHSYYEGHYATNTLGYI